MTGIRQTERLIEEIKLRQDRSNDHETLQGLAEVLEVLQRLGGWLEREPEGPTKHRVRQLLKELDWVSPDTLVTSRHETLRAGVLTLVFGLLE